MRRRTLPLNAIVSLLALGSTDCVLIAPVDDVVASTSVSDSPATPRCRKFATKWSEVYEVKSRGDDGEWRLDSDGRGSGSCSFDKAQLRLTCTTSDSSKVTTSMTSWRSLPDAVIENDPIGKISATAVTTDPAARCFDQEYSYDSDGRLTTVMSYSLSDTSQCTFDSVRTYTAWDTEGRPLVGTEQDMSSIEVCRTSAIAFNYDDTQGLVTRSITGSKAAECGSFDSPVTWTYDVDRLLVSTFATHNGFVFRTGLEHTTSSTSTITNRTASTICE